MTIETKEKDEVFTVTIKATVNEIEVLTNNDTPITPDLDKRKSISDCIKYFSQTLDEAVVKLLKL